MTWELGTAPLSSDSVQTSQRQHTTVQPRTTDGDGGVHDKEPKDWEKEAIRAVALQISKSVDQPEGPELLSDAAPTTPLDRDLPRSDESQAAGEMGQLALAKRKGQPVRDMPTDFHEFEQEAMKAAAAEIMKTAAPIATPPVRGRPTGPSLPQAQQAATKAWDQRGFFDRNITKLLEGQGREGMINRMAQARRAGVATPSAAGNITGSTEVDPAARSRRRWGALKKAPLAIGSALPAAALKATDAIGFTGGGSRPYQQAAQQDLLDVVSGGNINNPQVLGGAQEGSATQQWLRSRTAPSRQSVMADPQAGAGRKALAQAGGAVAENAENLANFATLWRGAGPAMRGAGRVPAAGTTLGRLGRVGGTTATGGALALPLAAEAAGRQIAGTEGGDEALKSVYENPAYQGLASAGAARFMPTAAGPATTVAGGGVALTEAALAAAEDLRDTPPTTPQEAAQARAQKQQAAQAAEKTVMDPAAPPEQKAKAISEAAVSAVNAGVGAETARRMAQEVQQGEISPEHEQIGVQNVAEGVAESEEQLQDPSLWEQAQSTFQSMDPGAKLGAMIGLPLGLLGLVGMFTGNKALGLLGAVLGFGMAGASGGLFGEGAQGWLSNLLGGAGRAVGLGGDQPGGEPPELGPPGDRQPGPGQAGVSGATPVEDGGQASDRPPSKTETASGGMFDEMFEPGGQGMAMINAAAGKMPPAKLEGLLAAANQADLIPQDVQQKLDTAVEARTTPLGRIKNLVARAAKQYAGFGEGGVSDRLQAAGLEDAQAQDNLLKAWASLRANQNQGT